MKYRKKPVEIEAIQFKRDSFEDIKEFTEGNNGSHSMWVPSTGDIFAEDWEVVK